MAYHQAVAKNLSSEAASNLLDDVALLIASPIVVPALLLGLRPVAKTVVKGSLLLSNMVTEFITMTRESGSQIAAEARAMTKMTGAAATAASTEPPQPIDEAEHNELQRITGIGEKFATLLREVGVGSLRDLARRNPENLHERLAQVNEQQQIVSHVPALELVEDWITQAQKEVR